MPDQRVILVTGVGGFFGSRVAAALAALPAIHVIGLDGGPPGAAIQGLDFVQADPRNALLPELLQDEHIDTLVHLAFQESERPAEAVFDFNVMGTIKLLGACAEAGVRKAVLRSSTIVYGARPDNSAFLAEDHALQASVRWGSARDLAEIETFCAGLAGQQPGMSVTILRFAGIVGPTVDSPMTRFLRETWTPLLLGFDPMMQVIHEDDVIRALVHATLNDVPGIYNVAAEGVLPLTQLIALAGKLPIPLIHLGVYWGVDLARAAGINVGRYVPIDPDYLRYPWVADLERMRLALGFAPHYSAKEALREFAGHQRLSRYFPDEAVRAFDEQRLRDTIEGRRRQRARGASASVTAQDAVPENGPLVRPDLTEAADD